MLRYGIRESMELVANNTCLRGPLRADFVSPPDPLFRLPYRSLSLHCHPGWHLPAHQVRTLSCLEKRQPLRKMMSTPTRMHLLSSPSPIRPNGPERRGRPKFPYRRSRSRSTSPRTKRTSTMDPLHLVRVPNRSLPHFPPQYRLPSRSHHQRQRNPTRPSRNVKKSPSPPVVHPWTGPN